MERRKQTPEKGIFTVMTLSGEREGICLFFPQWQILPSRPPRPRPLSEVGGSSSVTPQLESPGETPGAQRSPSQTVKPAELPAQLPPPISPPVGPSDLVPTEALAEWNHRACGSLCVLARNDLCSSHAAVTLALSATPAEAGDRPEKANGRNTLSSPSPLWR